MKLDTIVVGFDGSPTALRALDTAAQLVADTGVVHVVTAFRLPSAGDTAGLLAQMPEEFRINYNPTAAPEADLLRAATFLADRKVDCQPHLVDDHPASAILDIADQVDAQLIIVGSRGMSRSTRFLRGSVSTRIASHSARSFMVVHDEE
ncbi:MAG: universal stress protein [Acidimicrobiales bacterium]